MLVSVNATCQNSSNHNVHSRILNFTEEKPRYLL